MGIDRGALQWTAMGVGPLLALLVYLLLPESYSDASGEAIAFSHAGRATAAMGVWMAVWWMTEAIPVYATALIPLAFLPTVGASSIRDAASPYGHELIFLFMGGFMLALAMERWGLHTRIALVALRRVGSDPRSVVGGFMLITAALSMWVSNTATSIVMLPIALSVIRRIESRSEESVQAQQSNFALCLFLGIAYAASIGGIGTLIGTPPNLFLASFAESQLGREISFARWMGVGLPLVAVFLPATWWLLTRVIYPIRISRVEGGAEVAGDALRELGLMKRGEWATLTVFVATALAWILRPLLTRIELGGVAPFAGLTDPGIAILAALALFAIPVDLRKREFAIDWETAVKLPWGLLILFGGGLSLAAAVRANGVGEFIGHGMGALGSLPALVLVLGVTTAMILLTELTSNTATTATLIPILTGLAAGLGVDPFLLIVPAAIAASCAFMLPVATPPNAVVFGSGYVSIPEMARAGIWLNAIGVILITALTYLVAMPLLGVAPESLLSAATR
jgi:sodium-dependent dicarboxylate transporter 2/3/5